MISTVEKVLFLKGVDLFKSIPGEDLTHSAAIAEQIDFPAGYSVFSEGEPGETMFLILSGTVDIRSGDTVVASLGPKQCFGEMALLDAEPRSATVKATSELSALQIFHDDFTEMLAEKPEIARGIIKVLTRRLREANRRN